MQQLLPLLAHYQLVRADTTHPRRGEFEAFISQRYQLAFDADIQGFMPLLVGLCDTQGKLLSVCGLCLAKGHSLFLEQYLNAPAQTLLSRHFAQPISRHDIVEIGQLASFSSNLGLIHFTLLAQFLTEQGLQWAILTATGPLAALIKRFGLNTTVLSDANSDDLADSKTQWGRYYQQRPQVMAGNIDDSLTRLNQCLARRERRASAFSKVA